MSRDCRPPPSIEEVREICRLYVMLASEGSGIQMSRCQADLSPRMEAPFSDAALASDVFAHKWNAKPERTTPNCWQHVLFRN